VQLWVEMMEPYTNPGEVCYEPFCGSGTAIVAAHRLNRVCYAIELSPLFCDLAIARIEKDTGLKAVKVRNVPPPPEIFLSGRINQDDLQFIVVGLAENSVDRR
jgi:DNA methylase